MKIYKYKLKECNSVKVIDEYLVEFNLFELFDIKGIDELYRITFNSENEIERLEDDDNFLKVLEKLIKYEIVDLPKETIRKIWEIYMAKKESKNRIKKIDECFEIIWKEIHNDGI